MILRKSALLPLLLSPPPAAAYFAQVNNAHVEFVATGGAVGDAPNGAAVETVDDRPSLQHGAASLWTALEGALEGKSELGYAAPRIMGLFEEWVERFGREYETVEEKGERMLIWLENHGGFRRVPSPRPPRAKRSFRRVWCRLGPTPFTVEPSRSRVCLHYFFVDSSH